MARRGFLQRGPEAGRLMEGSGGPASDVEGAEALSHSNRAAPPAARERVLPRPKPALSTADRAFANSLRARALPPKEPLHIPEGRDLRLTVKLADDLMARPDADGRLIVHTDDAGGIRELRELASKAGLAFRRAHTLTDDQLAALSRRAAEKSGNAQPDLAAHVEAVAPAAAREHVIALARALHGLPGVEYAELESRDMPPPPPAVDLAPVTPLLEHLQTYRAAATGVNVDFVWNTYGIRGDAGLRVTDCEYNYNPDHEDLAGLVQLQAGVVSKYTAFGNDHGTAVLGVLSSGWNAYGTTGSVPECEAWFFPEYSNLESGFQSRAACVTAAIAASASGDIVVLEMQTDGPASGTTDYVPAEYALSVWNAVKTGTDAGVITIAAAGNGNQNLDDAGLFSAYHARGDSGAIIVGAGTSARAKYSFSSHGSRVNVQGWGGGVVTTGYGTHATYGGDPNQKYASSFGGTSSATPVVTSAAALLQSVAIKILGRRLSPLELRNLLVSTGRAQTGSNAATAPIGPLPELEAATAALFAADPPVLATLESWGHFHFASGTPDLDADWDKDGLPDLLEYLLGTDPKGSPPGDALRVPRAFIESTGGTERVVFEFHQPAARTGASWTVQMADSLASHAWQTVVHGAGGASVTRAGDTIRAEVPVTADMGAAFLRLKATLP